MNVTFRGKRKASANDVAICEPSDIDLFTSEQPLYVRYGDAWFLITEFNLTDDIAALIELHEPPERFVNRTD